MLSPITLKLEVGYIDPTLRVTLSRILWVGVLLCLILPTEAGGRYTFYPEVSVIH
jgi:hypothetical protein